MTSRFQRSGTALVSDVLSLLNYLLPGSKKNKKMTTYSRSIRGGTKPSSR